MDTNRTGTVLSLEELRDPEKRGAYEEASSVKVLQKNLAAAILEARNTIDSFKEASHVCGMEILNARESKEKDVNSIEPLIKLEIEDLIEKLRGEIIGQNCENMKMNKQTQVLNKEKTILQQLTAESLAKFDKIEGSMSVR